METTTGAGRCLALQCMAVSLMLTAVACGPDASALFSRKKTTETGTSTAAGGSVSPGGAWAPVGNTGNTVPAIGSSTSGSDTISAEKAAQVNATLAAFCANYPTAPAVQVVTGCKSTCGWSLPKEACESYVPTGWDAINNAKGQPIEPAPFVDPVLAPFVTSFQGLAASNGIPIDPQALTDMIVVKVFANPPIKTYTAADGEVGFPSMIAGYCETNLGVDASGNPATWTQVEIDSSFANPVNPTPQTLITRDRLVYHELVHCLLRLGHSVEPCSIMDPGGLAACPYPTQDEENADMAELFTRGYLDSIPVLPAVGSQG